MSEQPPNYLEPYLAAIQRNGPAFRSLLWSSEATQEARFIAIAEIIELSGKSILDVGCGRGDLLDFLRNRHIDYAHYVGLEAIDSFADQAQARCGEREMIVRADFVRDPGRMYAGADVVIFCGSLNTLNRASFHDTLRHGLAATAGTMVFNFLCSPLLSNAKHLTWHPATDVVDFLRPLAHDLIVRDEYLDGDCTIAARKGSSF